MLAFQIILLVLLAGITIADFKHRMFHWIYIPLLFFVYFFINIKVLDIPVLLRSSFLNLVLVTFYFLALTVYFSVKNKALINIVDTQIGLGDILFILVACIIFTPINLIGFLIITCLLALFYYFIYSLINRKNKQLTFTVPFAGLMSVALIIINLIEIGIQSTIRFNDFIVLCI